MSQARVASKQEKGLDQKQSFTQDTDLNEKITWNFECGENSRIPELRANLVGDGGGLLEQNIYNSLVTWLGMLTRGPDTQSTQHQLQPIVVTNIFQT